MSTDIGESYDVAAGHPDVGRVLRQRIAAKLKTSPQEIQTAKADLLKWTLVPRQRVEAGHAGPDADDEEVA
jgi:hypothetical protein